MAVISDSVVVGGVPYNGATVNAYLASRCAGYAGEGVPFSPPLAQGAAPPGGSPDGTAISGTNEGSLGAFQVTVPSGVDIYLQIVVPGSPFGWKLYPTEGSVTTVTAADGTIIIGGTTSSPTVRVGTVPYADLSGAPVILAAADSTIVVGGTVLAPTVRVGSVPGSGLTWPLTFSGDMGFQPDGVANNSLTLQNAVSAVNGVQLVGGATGTAPIVQAVGSDTTIGLTFQLKGTGLVPGTVLFNTGGTSGIADFYLGGTFPNVTNTQGGFFFTFPGIWTWSNAWPSGQNSYISIDNAGGTGGGNINIVGQTSGSAGAQINIQALNGLNLTSTLAGQTVYVSAATPGSVVVAGSSIAGRAALTATSVTSGVNGVTVTEAVTGANPSIAATGSDATVGLNIVLKGAAPLLINGAAGSATQVLTSNGASAAPTWQPASGVTWPLTNSGDETFQPNSIASSALTLHNNATAVNGITITGTATTVNPILAPTGSDTNIGLVINGKGSGTVFVYSNTAAGSVLLGGNASPTTAGQAALTVTGIASGVNGMTITQAAAAGGPTIAATGSDTNIGLFVTAKGSGSVQLQNGGTAGLVVIGNDPTLNAPACQVNNLVSLGSQPMQLLTRQVANSVLLGGSASNGFPGRVGLTVTGVTSGVNGVTITQSVTGSGTSIAATGSDTNLNLLIAAKGTGSVTINATFAIDSAGHIISTSAGTPATTNLGTNVTSATFTGNDVRGTIAIVIAAGGLTANTRACTATFATTYGATSPKVTLVDQTSTSGLTVVNSYVSAQSTGVSFDIAFDQALVSGTYVIDYICIG